MPFCYYILCIHRTCKYHPLKCQEQVSPSLFKQSCHFEFNAIFDWKSDKSDHSHQNDGPWGPSSLKTMTSFHYQLEHRHIPLSVKTNHLWNILPRKNFVQYFSTVSKCLKQLNEKQFQWKFFKKINSKLLPYQFSFNESFKELRVLVKIVSEWQNITIFNLSYFGK